MLAKTALRRIANKDLKEASNGVLSYFFPLSKKWGVKLTSDSYKTQILYERQQRAVNFGIAPKVGDFVQTRLNDIDMYGFITERAILPAEYIFNQRGVEFPGMKEFRRNYEFQNILYDESNRDFPSFPKLRKAYFKLLEAIEVIGEVDGDFAGGLHTDLHVWNWGLIGSKAVVIDFSFGFM